MEGRPTRRFPSTYTSHAEQERQVDEVRGVTFPVAMRGYDRQAVDAYVERVHRLLAELEISRSPESAVKHAVAQVSEETRGILQRAHETAEDITARSRVQADDRLQLAEREAAEVRAAAEAHVRALDNDAEAIWGDRMRLIEDIRDVARRLLMLAEEAVARFPSPHAEDETQAMPALEAATEADPPGESEEEAARATDSPEPEG
jgi:DivIVA domain-containing protein